MTKPKTYPPLSYLLEQYRKQFLSRSSPQTLHQYFISIENFRQYLKHRPTLKDLTNENVRGCIDWMVSRERSESTANKCRANLLALWRFAAREGQVKKWPSVQKLIEPDRIPTAWSADQLHRLFSAIGQAPGEIEGIPARLWWLSLHSVLWDTGERIGAVLKTTPGDLDLDGATVIFRAKNRKFHKRDRCHPLHSHTVSLLRSIEKPSRSLVWPTGCCYATLLKRYKAILRAASLPTDRKHMLHCMRRSTASFYEAAGGNATDLLDHSSRDITKRYYLDTRVLPMQGPAMMEFRPKAG